MIYCWYRTNWHEAFSIIRRGILFSVVVVLFYSLLDVFYLSGIWWAKTILVFLNPIVHDIRSAGTWWPPLLWSGQLRSLFAEPSYFGIFAAFAMPWIWYSFCTQRNQRMKIGYAALFIIYAMCLFFTKARTANALFIGELVLFGIASIFCKKGLFRNFCLILICTIFTFGISTFGLSHMPGSPEKAEMMLSRNNVNHVDLKQYLDDNVGSLASADKRSNRARYSILNADLKIGMDHPILGVGRSLRNAYIPDYLPQSAFQSNEVLMWIKNQKEKGVMKSGVPALGEYSSRFAETGFLGLIIYIYPAVLLLYKFIKIIRNQAISQQDRLKYVFLGISLMGVIASGLGDNINITCAYWILLGVGYSMGFGQKISVINKEI